MSDIPIELADNPVLNLDHVRKAAEQMLCGGGDSPAWRACQSVAKAYLDDLKAREENIQPVQISEGPFRITTDGVSEWRVHGPGIQPASRGWLFRSHGMALDCASAGNIGFHFGQLANQQ